MPEEPFSPEWWLKKLKKELDTRRLRLEKYDAYYSGEHRLKFSSPRFREAFGGLFVNFADNWCELVVDAVLERLKPAGFRIGEDPKGDKRAWDIWQANDLDFGSYLAHQEALVNEVSYALVWPGGDGQPVVTIEHPDQMIVAMEVGSYRRRAAALKCWEEDDGTRMATLYLPDFIYKFKARKGTGTPTWMDREVSGEEWPLPNSLGVVPVVPIPNRPRLLKPPVSEIRSVMPKQDAVNKLLIDMLVASEFAGFRQRFATGLELEEDPETKKKIEPFKSAIDRLWVTDNADASFGEFEATDLGNYVKAVEMVVQHIASQTRTPPHYFYLSGNFPSGESIKSAETGLVAKARNKMIPFGDAWETVMRLAFQITGDRRRAQIAKSEMLWGDPESRSESELADSVMKKRALGVPLRQCWTDLGYSQQQQDDFMKMLQQEAEAGLLPPNPALAPGSPVPQPQPAA